MPKTDRDVIGKLANTTSGDMKDSLGLEWTDNPALLRGALRICKRRGEKTKAAMLARKINKLKKEK